MQTRKISSNDKMNNLMVRSEVPKKFCQETSLHGWKYLNTETKFTLKLMWFVVLLSAIMASVYFMFYYTAQFMAATTVTTIDSTIAPITVMFDEYTLIIALKSTKYWVLDEHPAHIFGNKVDETVKIFWIKRQ